MSEADYPSTPLNKVVSTLSWGLALGTLAGILLCFFVVYMMFSMGERWNSINWPILVLFFAGIYVAPLAALGVLIALPVAACGYFFRHSQAPDPELRSSLMSATPPVDHLPARRIPPKTAA